MIPTASRMKTASQKRFLYIYTHFAALGVCEYVLSSYQLSLCVQRTATSTKEVLTLEKSEDSITLKKQELGLEIDPVFQKTYLAFDEGGARGLLLNNLSTMTNCAVGNVG
jgi:hypothetical protein